MSQTETLLRLPGTLIYWGGFLLSTLIFSLLSPLCWLLPRHKRMGFYHPWRAFNLWTLKIFCGLSYRVSGLEYLPKEPIIVLAKHQSTLETIVLPQFLPSITWVLKRELTWLPFFGWALLSISPIAINRSAGRRAMSQLVEQGKDRLASGISVVIFPEGTRVPPGEKGRYKIGGAFLAAESGYPVLPITHNTGYFWKKGQFVKNPGTAEFIIGPLIESKGKSAEELLKESESWIETNMPVK